MICRLPLPPGCRWVGVSQIEELRRPFVSLYGIGMRESIYMDELG